jgi:hypothetical protein
MHTDTAGDGTEGDVGTSWRGAGIGRKRKHNEATLFTLAITAKKREAGGEAMARRRKKHTQVQEEKGRAAVQQRGNA